MTSGSTRGAGRRLRVWSLRARVAAAFGVGSLLVTGLVSIAAWHLTTDYALSQREQSTLRQATVNARLVDRSLRTDPGNLDGLLTGLAGSRSTVLVRYEGRWLTRGDLAGPSDLPDRFREHRGGRAPVRQRIEVGGTELLAIGLAISDTSLYVEVFPVSELQQTTAFLGAFLAGGTLVAALLGSVVGWWTSVRAFRPLTVLTGVAARVARGDLSARIPDTTDPDLAPLADAFNRTVGRLQERVQRDARFAGDVSHELRSPLTTIANAVAVLARRRAELPGSAGQAAELLDGEVRRFQLMVANLLEIAKADEDQDTLSSEDVDLVELVTEAAKAGRHDLPVESAGPVPVRVDRRRMERLLANLLSNAEQHAGGAVRLAVVGSAGLARIEVDDAGPGIAAEDRERVFERFTRGAAARQDRADVGSGLGLALARRHAQAHGGRIWAEDRAKGGARFVVELPAMPITG